MVQRKSFVFSSCNWETEKRSSAHSLLLLFVSGLSTRSQDVVQSEGLSEKVVSHGSTGAGDDTAS